VSCGDWDVYQAYTKYDWEKLYAAQGQEGFLDVGGKIKNKKEFGGDNKAFDTAVAQNRVSPDVVEACTSIERKYHAPKKLVTV
jgi:hypothetical protein